MTKKKQTKRTESKLSDHAKVMRERKAAKAAWRKRQAKRWEEERHVGPASQSRKDTSKPRSVGATLFYPKKKVTKNAK